MNNTIIGVAKSNEHFPSEVYCIYIIGLNPYVIVNSQAGYLKHVVSPFP